MDETPISTACDRGTVMPAGRQGWILYLLECADGTLYCGVTTDMARRLAEHGGELPGGARYTRSRRPVRLLAQARLPDRAAACRAEAGLKKLPRKRKLAALLALARSGEGGQDGEAK